MMNSTDKNPFTGVYEYRTMCDRYPAMIATGRDVCVCGCNRVVKVAGIVQSMTTYIQAECTMSVIINGCIVGPPC